MYWHIYRRTHDQPENFFKRVGAFLCASPSQAQDKFRVMEYNVENLFDCSHDSLKNDYEFQPDSPRGWTKARYYDKLAKIAKVILAGGRQAGS